MSNEHCIVITTFSGADVGRRIIDGLIKEHLAACVQSVDITSSYHWKGAVNNEKETLLLIKTKTSLYPQVEAFIKSSHSYEVPEIIQVPISAGFAGYLKWMDQECK